MSKGKERVASKEEGSSGDSGKGYPMGRHQELFRRMYHVKHKRSELIVLHYMMEQQERGIHSSSSYWKRTVPHLVDISLVTLFICMMMFSAMVSVGVGFTFSLVVSGAVLMMTETPFLCMLIYAKRDFFRVIGMYTISLVLFVTINGYQCIQNTFVSNPRCTGNVVYDVFGTICCCFYCLQSVKCCRTSTFCPITCCGRTVCGGRGTGARFRKLVKVGKRGISLPGRYAGDGEDGEDGEKDIEGQRIASGEVCLDCMGTGEDEDGVTSIAMVDLGLENEKRE